MGFSREDLETLEASGINQSQAEAAASELLGIRQDAVNVYNMASPETYAESLQGIVDLTTRILTFQQNYQNPSVRQILAKNASEQAGMTPEAFLDVPNYAQRVKEIGEEAKTEPQSKTMIDQSLAKNPDVLDHAIDTLSSAEAIVSNEHSINAENALASLEPLENMKNLYERAENVRFETGLSNEDALTVYRGFLYEYDRILKDAASQPGAEQAVRDHVDRQIGIPPHIFGDMGSHYTTLITTIRAENIQSIMEAAENIAIEGSLDEQKEKLNEKKELIEQAKKMISPKPDEGSALSVLEPSPAQVEAESGYSEGVLTRMIEDIDHDIDVLNAVQATPDNADTIKLETYEDAPSTQPETATPDNSPQEDSALNVNNYTRPSTSNRMGMSA